MMSVTVERFSSPGKGNGLRAVSGVPAGARVWAAAPRAAVVSNSQTGEVCSGCFTRPPSLRRCSQCQSARYCSVACQRRAWPVHKRECVCLRDLLPRVPTDSVRLAARILFTTTLNSAKQSEELYSLEEHQSHLASMSEQKRRGLSQLADMLQMYLQPGAPPLREEMTSLPSSCRDPLSLLAKVVCNCFTISDEELKEVGVGLYPSLSLLNHDCRPNCVVVFQGPQGPRPGLQGPRPVLRAVRDVAAGEELCISYIDTLAVTAERQRQLSDQYCFTCTCHCCRTQAMDGAMLSGEEVSWRVLEEALPRLEALQAGSQWAAVLEACGSLLGGAGRALPDHNLHKLRVQDLALDACVNLGAWGRALAYGLNTLTAYRMYYPDPHPAHGLQLMRVGKLHHYLGDTQEAVVLLTQAYEILRTTHGEQSPLTAGLALTLDQCRAETH